MDESWDQRLQNAESGKVDWLREDHTSRQEQTNLDYICHMLLCHKGESFKSGTHRRPRSQAVETWHQARPSASGSLPRRNLQTYQGDQQWGWSLGGCCPSSCPTTGLWCARDPCKILATALDLVGHTVFFACRKFLHLLAVVGEGWFVCPLWVLTFFSAVRNVFVAASPPWSAPWARVRRDGQWCGHV